MSVIEFGIDEMNTFKGMLKYNSTGGNTSYFNSLRYCDAYKEEERFEKDERKALGKFFDRLLWYVRVANKVAFSLQYGEEVKFHDEDEFDVEWDKTSGIVASLTETVSALRHIKYNLCTNDGRVFLPEAWGKAFDLVESCLMDACFDRMKSSYNNAAKERALWEIVEHENSPDAVKSISLSTLVQK